jgi:thioredoxin-related protein
MNIYPSMTQYLRAALLLAPLFLFSACDAVSGLFGEDEPLPEFSLQYNPEHDPGSDLNFAIAMAEETDRRVLMLVGGDWCPWCRSMDTFFAENSDLNDQLHGNFVLLKVYYGRENYNREFLAGFPRLMATPHFYVMEKDGTQLYSQETTPLEKGRSYDPLKMGAFLQRWSPNQ